MHLACQTLRPWALPMHGQLLCPRAVHANCCPLVSCEDDPNFLQAVAGRCCTAPGRLAA